MIRPAAVESPGHSSDVAFRLESGSAGKVEQLQLNRGNAATTMVLSTLYLPGTTANVQHQHAPTGGFYAGQRECPVMTDTVW